jgi:hypothetical protein
MKKTQLKVLATKIHGLAVKSANGKKPAQNKAIERIATLLNQRSRLKSNKRIPALLLKSVDWRTGLSQHLCGER